RAASEYKLETPPAGVAEHAVQRIERVSDEPRDRERNPDLRVGQTEVVTYERPRRAERAVHELVEELDCKQEEDDAGSSAPANATLLTGRASGLHRPKCRRKTCGAKVVKSLRLQNADAE